jgi:hypothetical protein
MSPPALVSDPLRYLIGADDDAITAALAAGDLVEISYDYEPPDPLHPPAFRYGTFTDETGRYRSHATANARGRYRPYLPPDGDITGEYGEWCPDPAGQGFLANVRDQLARAAHALRLELDNPDFAGLSLDAVLQAHDLAWAAHLNTAAKNPLNVADPRKYVSHPSVDLCIVERGPHGSDDMEHLRQAVGQPLLAVRFVGFREHPYPRGGQDDYDWCRAVAQEIRARGYRNMGVTYSPDGEYTSSHDVQVPLP